MSALDSGSPWFQRRHSSRRFMSCRVRGRVRSMLAGQARGLFKGPFHTWPATVNTSLDQCAKNPVARSGKLWNQSGSDDGYVIGHDIDVSQLERSLTRPFQRLLWAYRMNRVAANRHFPNFEDYRVWEPSIENRYNIKIKRSLFSKHNDNNIGIC